MEPHPIFAAVYDWVMVPQDWLGLRKQRQEIVHAAKGKVLELGVGTGLNLPLYREVTKVIGVDPDPYMLKRAYARLKKAAAPIELCRSSAEELPFEEGTFDTVVSTLVFCTIPDADKAAREVHRVLKPEGTFQFLEHVKSETPVLAKAQDALTPLWKKLFGGCHLNRNTLALFQRNGFEITRLQKVKYDVVWRGTARPSSSSS